MTASNRFAFAVHTRLYRCALACAWSLPFAGCASSANTPAPPQQQAAAGSAAPKPSAAAGAQPDAALAAAAADASTDAGADCGTPIPDGELQNKASGPSVFGRVVGGDLGLFDPLGGTACGVAGTRVCVLGTSSCTDSDQAGQYVLGDLTVGSDAEISFEKAGFDSGMRLVQVDSNPIDLHETRLVTSASAAQQAEQAGGPRPAGMGSLVVAPLAAGEAIGSLVLPGGVSILLMPGDRTPLYSRGEIEPGGLSSDDLDPSLSATQPGGWGIFIDVEPGDYALQIERNGMPCDQSLPGFGWGFDDMGNVKVKVVAGFTTTGITALCP